MKRYLEAEPPADPVLQLLDLVAMELDDFAARNADDVVVVPLAGPAFEKLTLPLAHGLLDDAAFQKKRDRPVNGAPRDTGVLAAERVVQAVGVEVAPQAGDLLVDVLALAGELEVLLFEQVFEPGKRVHGASWYLDLI